MTGEAFEHVPKPAILETLVIDTPDGTRTPTILDIEHQSELHSTDADVARFVGLRWSKPVA